MLLGKLLRDRDQASVPAGLVDSKSNNATQASRLTVNGWLKEISNAVGKNISLNTSGICAFTYEEYTIVIEVRNDFAFLYAMFDVKRFAIDQDSYKDLLVDIRVDVSPIIYFAMDINISPSASEGDVQSNDLVAGVNRRVEEMDSQSFRDMLESFIEVVLKAGERLDLCVAKRYLRSQLMHYRQPSNSSAPQKEIGSAEPSPSEEKKDAKSETTASANSAFERLSLQVQQILMKAEEIKQVNSILNNIESFLSEKPAKKDPMSSEDMDTFRTLLDDQFSKLNIHIQKSMKTNEMGVVAFTYEDLTIVLEPVSPKLFGVSATVFKGRVGHKIRKNALLMNYLGQYTRGGVIKEMQSMSTNGAVESEIMFVHHDRVDLNFREFRDVLENFIDTALKIKKELSTYHDTLYKDAESRRIEADFLHRGKAILDELSEGNKSILIRIFTVKNNDKILAHLDSLGNLVANTGKSELWYNVGTLILDYASSFCDAQQVADPTFMVSVQAQVFHSCLKNKFFDEKFIVMCLHKSFDSPTILNRFIQKVFHTREMIEIGKMHEILSNIISVTQKLCDENSKRFPDIETNSFNEYCEYILLYARDQQHAKEAILCLDWIFDKKPVEPTQNSALLLQTATTHNPKEIWSWLIRKMKTVLTEDHFKYILQQNYFNSRTFEKMNGESIAIIEGIINRMKIQREHDKNLHSEGPQFYIDEVFNSLQWNGNNIWEATSGELLMPLITRFLL